MRGLTTVSMLVVAVGASACAETSTSLRKCLSVGTGVSLHGRVVFEQQFGPPNFGETPKTDTRLRVPVLHVAQPFSVCGDADHKVTSVRRVQLITGGTVLPGVRDFHGRLYFPDTAAQYTPVVMFVDSSK